MDRIWYIYYRVMSDLTLLFTNFKECHLHQYSVYKQLTASGDVLSYTQRHITVYKKYWSEAEALNPDENYSKNSHVLEKLKDTLTHSNC